MLRVDWWFENKTTKCMSSKIFSIIVIYTSTNWSISLSIKVCFCGRWRWSKQTRGNVFHPKNDRLSKKMRMTWSEIACLTTTFSSLQNMTNYSNMTRAHKLSLCDPKSFKPKRYFSTSFEAWIMKRKFQ